VLKSGFEYDVQKRVPSTDKAKKILGFSADTELSTMLDEVIPWIKSASKAGLV
jgi:nucleoside-diphosphate-sugar epimerase